MTSAARKFAVAAALILVAAGCSGPRRGPPQQGMPGQMRPISEQEQNIRLMLSFDGNSDGTVTRDEMETALKRQFEACDLNHDGRIDLREMQVENDRRFRAFGTGASPLIDWNQNGQIEFEEFATTARSVFAELDKDHDGKLDMNELRIPRLPGNFVPAENQERRRQ
ncbi:MAG TPA: hypothetical protein VNH44_09995 [Micropepsaceae bacterium]|nr:hypothetical protein [Micropepsaceae bacterium]